MQFLLSNLGFGPVLKMSLFSDIANLKLFKHWKSLFYFIHFRWRFFYTFIYLRYKHFNIIMYLVAIVFTVS